MAINKNAPAPLTGALQPQAGAPSALASLGGTTQALRAVQQAATGRARQAGPIQEDIIQEQVALQEAQAGQQVMQEQARQMEAGAELQRAEQEQQFKFNLQEMDERQVNASQELMNRSLAILQDFEQGRAKLELGKDKARMEQALFGMRLSNKKYLDQLEIEGRKRRLDNAVQFKEALTETLFKEELDLLKSDISFKRKLAGDEREFEKLLTEIDLDTALRLVMQESEATNIAMITQGAKEIISGGLRYASRKEEE
jgi:hypothetical protein